LSYRQLARSMFWCSCQGRVLATVGGNLGIGLVG
jgi:hypothetical protein